MKRKTHINWSKSLLLGAGASSVLFATQMTQADDFHNNYYNYNNKPQVGNVFVILMENHNFAQPNPASSPQQILGNPAAPYMNSLITPGNANAAQVSYATAYYNTGVGVHPSEPNYVWAEAGSDFGFHSDADPSPANGNAFYDNAAGLVSHLTANGNTVVFWHRNHTPHLLQQLNETGISWNNYQEDVQLSVSPTNSASGTNGPVNPYNGTTQYNYAVKHNPAAFFGETAEENIFPLSQLSEDLSNNMVGRFNWITPDQYDDAHSALNGGFTYQGTHFTGDQASIAQGDNFLSIVVPEIMASKAYQNNGVIIIWWDETEGGDSGSFTLPEFVISPLAKGNAYASSVFLSHSSDTKTFEEIFGLPFVNNPIPVNETNFLGSYNNVATANDLSDLFVSGVIPSPTNITVTVGSPIPEYQPNHVKQIVHITNNGSSPIPGPLFLALDNLSSGATLINSDGDTAVLAPLGSPYVKVEVEGFSGNTLRPGQSATAFLEFLDPGDASISYNPRVLSVTPAP